jgi:L-threonylcarbamoyladenylate synthase
VTGRPARRGADGDQRAPASVGPEQISRLEDCLAADGVLLFPADTVYGLACDPDSPIAVERLYALKGRAPGKPAAVMFFELERAFALLLAPASDTGADEPAGRGAGGAGGERGRGRERGPAGQRGPGRLEAALRALLPGPVTVLVPNPQRRFDLACAGDPDTLGLRVPRLPERLSALAGVARPVLQSSANLAGGADPVTLADVPASIRDGVDLALDGGRLPGVASTVVDLRLFERDRSWRVLRAGALSGAEIERLLCLA